METPASRTKVALTALFVVAFCATLANGSDLDRSLEAADEDSHAEELLGGAKAEVETNTPLVDWVADEPIVLLYTNRTSILSALDSSTGTVVRLGQLAAAYCVEYWCDLVGCYTGLPTDYYYMGTTNGYDYFRLERSAYLRGKRERQLFSSVYCTCTSEVVTALNRTPYSNRKNDWQEIEFRFDWPDSSRAQLRNKVSRYLETDEKGEWHWVYYPRGVNKELKTTR